MLNDSIPELQDIDALDVLDLGGEFPKMSGNLIMSSRIIKVKGELAQQVASLWRQLKPGESALNRAEIGISSKHLFWCPPNPPKDTPKD